VLATLFLLAGVIGCGGKGDHSGTISDKAPGQSHNEVSPARQRTNLHPQPKGRFVRQANAICQRLIPRVEAIRSRFLFNNDPAAQQRGFALLVHEISAALGQIKALRQPALGRRPLRRLYRAAAASITELDQASRDARRTRRILAGTDPFAKTALLARAYGLTACQETAQVTSSP
jgi:hypothetical protein